MNSGCSTFVGKILQAVVSATIALAGHAIAATTQSQTSVDDILRAYDGAVPGASVLVISHGKMLVRRSFGLANIEDKTAATPQTNYRLASMTKQFTAAAILLLAEDKRLSLDDPVRKWLPSLPKTDDAILIRHLLTHTAGLIDYEDIMPATLKTQLRDIDVLHLLEENDVCTSHQEQTTATAMAVIRCSR